MENTHSPKFEQIQRYYNTWKNGKRLWDETRVANAVVKGLITPSEYTEITGEPYESE